MSEKAQQEFGKYKLVQKIGQETMADIFKAEETQSGKTVILKVLSAAVSTNELFAKFFGDRDAVMGHHVEHPNILSVLDCGEIGKRYYVAIEYVEGETLARRVKEGKIQTEEGLEILRQLAEALRAAQKKQIVHGDIKPANIILTRDRRNQLLAKLSFVDLALSSVDSTVSIFGEMLGTPKYMSPEQIKGRLPDARSDMYSLGVTAYEMFAGHLPFDCETLVGYLYRNVNDDPIPLAQLHAGIPREISLICEKLMSKDPSDRYKTAQRLIEDIEQAEMRILGQYVESAPPPKDSAFAPRVEKPVEEAVRPQVRKRVVVAVALLVVLIGGVIAGVVKHDELVKLASKVKAKVLPHEKKTSPTQTPDEAAKAAETKAKREKLASSLLAQGREHEFNLRIDDARRVYEEVAGRYGDTSVAGDARSALTGLKARSTAPDQTEEVPTSETAQAYSSLVRRCNEHIQGERFEDAAKAYKEFAERHAGTSLGTKARESIPYVLYSWAERAMTKGAYDAALEKYAEIKKEFPESKWAGEADKQTAQANCKWGLDLLKKRDYEGAAARFESVLSTHRNTEWGEQAAEKFPEAAYQSAKNDLKKRDFDGCVAKLRELTIKYAKTEWGEKAREELPKVLYDRSLALLKADDVEQADAGMREIIEKYPESPFAEKASQKLLEVQQAACKAAFEKGRIEDGLERYDRFVEANPGSAWKPVRDQELEQYRDLVKKHKPEAEKAQQKVTMDLVLYRLGLELAGEGKVNDAMEKHQLLIKEYPISPWAEKAKLGMPKLMYDCASFWIRKGDSRQAGAILNDLVKKFPGDEYATKGQEDLRHVLNVPQGMVYVPAGDLLMGSTEDDIAMAVAGQEKYKKEDFMDEIPRHVVRLNAFYIDIHEVTCADYKKFIDETKREAPLNWLRGVPMRGKENHPVVMVGYEDAEAFATWAAKRLPTEEEWEMAARGKDGRVFCWGNQYQENTCNIMSGKRLATQPVGSYPAGASPFGCLDMIGNAAEWVSGWYAPYPGSTLKSEKFGETHRVMRGGSWQTEVPAGARCARRAPVPAKSQNYAEDYFTIGFRCAKGPQ